MKKINYSLAILTVLTLFLLPSCQDKKAKEDLLKFQQTEAAEASNIEVIKQFYKLLDEQNMEACNDIFSAEGKCYMGSSEESLVFEDMIPFIQMYYSAFPDYQHHIENIFAADDYVVAQLKYTGMHSSKFMEIDSTGNNIEYKGIFIIKMADGKIIELWGMEDDLTMMTQLGLELN
ncbi:MAG: ester cyclase [Bacteroidetes bacterium]|nr:ester cyclase [Bacteroidota bacterium]